MTASTTYKIDAQGKKLGRIASDAASALAGKKAVDYVKYKITGMPVVIENASKMDIKAKKRGQKEYTRYTYYPGGLKKETMDDLIAKKGFEEVLKKAIYGMLPRNKLRAQMMKRLTIKA